MTETTTVKQQLKIPTTLKALVEALIFAAQEPLSLAQIKAISAGDSKNDEAVQIETETIRQAVADLNKDYEKASKPVPYCFCSRRLPVRDAFRVCRMAGAALPRTRETKAVPVRAGNARYHCV